MRIITNRFSDRVDNNKFTDTLDASVGKQAVRFLDTEYKLPTYVITTPSEKDDNVMLMINMISGEFDAISKVEYEAILNKTLKDINPFLYDYLIQQWTLIPEYMDEQTLIDVIRNNRLSDYRLTDPLKVNTFYVLTTMACNARCYYCYEKNYDHNNKMTPEIANDVADYLIKTISNTMSGFDKEQRSRKYNKTRLTWFGGEPLVNFEAIRIIVDRLNEAGIEFISYGISNGYLLNEDKIKYLKNEGHCERFQITLDGVGEKYAKAKNYANGDPDPFSTIEKNIKLCIDNGIEVTIRLNVGLHNYDDIVEVVKWFFEKFVLTLTKEQRRMVGIYSHGLFSTCEGGAADQAELDKLYEKETELVKLMYSYTYDYEEYDTEYIIHQYNLRKIGGLKYGSCDLSNDRSAVISPDGKINKCEHSLEESNIGSIYDHYLDYDTSIQDSWLAYRDRNDRCRTCPYYASCTTARNCYGSEVCSPGFVKYIDYLSKFYMNLMYNREIKIEKEIINNYRWTITSDKISSRSIDDLEVLRIDDRNVFILNILHLHSNDYIVTIPVDSIEADIKIYKYTMNNGIINIYDMDSLEESLVAYNSAHRIVDPGLLNKIINANLLKKGGEK